MNKENFLRKVRRTGTSLGVNIPQEVLDLLGIKEGDLLRVEIQKIKKGS